MLVHSDPDLHISTQIRERGIWEPYESQLLWRSLGAGDCFLDVGANIGYFSMLGAARVGSSGKVFAFEPEPRNYELLVANTALNHFELQLTAVQAALSDREGRGELFLHPDNLGDHQLFMEGAADASRQRIDAALLRGASWFGETQRFALVKIDTQGSEHQVIQGLLPLLLASCPGLRMLVELTPKSLRAAGTTGAALIETLAQLQLPFFIVDHIEHRLVASSAGELQQWCSNLDEYPEDAGFMNIFLGAAL